jgi:membrane protease YdiL (CAAX protease family)
MVGLFAYATLLVVFVLHNCKDGVHSLVAPYTVATRFGLKTISSRYPRDHPLWYRELDDEDSENDPAMIKVKSRAPPGYDMKKAIQQHYAPPRTGGRPPRNGINQFLIRALTLNQYLILGIALVISAAIIFFKNGLSGFGDLNEVLQWSGGDVEVFDLNVTPERLLIGVGAAMPLLAVSNIIENSDRRAFANINFSTITMCLTLFGRRSVPIDDFLPAQYKGANAAKFPITSWQEAAAQSFILSSITGFCEESVFRRLVPAMILLLLGPDGNPFVAYIGQALLFGLGHAQPGNKLTENGILIGLQMFNGLGTGLVYFLTGGDLVPCIISHATYDFIVFFKTWKDANDQLEYAEAMSKKPLPSDSENQVRSLIPKLNPNIDPDLAYKLMKRMFYLFDIDKNETLTLSEVRKGIAYMAIERKVGKPPSQSEVDRLFASIIPPGESRLSFPDFIRLISQSNKKLRTAI